MHLMQALQIHIEKLYYSANFADICVYCGEDVGPWSKSKPHPQCEDCADKPKISTKNVLLSFELCSHAL